MNYQKENSGFSNKGSPQCGFSRKAAKALVYKDMVKALLRDLVCSGDGRWDTDHGDAIQTPGLQGGSGEPSGAGETPAPILNPLINSAIINNSLI